MRLTILIAVAAAAVSLAVGAAPASAAQTLTVTTIADDPGGVCPKQLPEQCSLRAAVAQNLADGGGDRVILPPGNYGLASPLSVTRAISIVGTGAAADTTIDAAGHKGALILDLDQQADQGVLLQHLTVTGSVGASAISANFVNELILDDVRVVDNQRAGGFGGGLELGRGNSVRITNGLFARNTALGGGAIAVDTNNLRQRLEIDDSELQGNRAGAFGGGGLLAGFADVSIDRSRLDGNTAQFGGAIAAVADAFEPSIALSNSTLDGNTATDVSGGAVYLSGVSAGTLQAHSDTFLDDRAPVGGAFDGPPAAVLMRDSVLGHSTSQACADTNVVSSQGHNVASDRTCGLHGTGDREGLDPHLGPVADNGGPTLTALPVVTSPLLDAADPAACPSTGQHTDQRNVPRPQGTGCDIGAAERAVGVPHAVTGSPDRAAATGTVDPGGQPTAVTVEYGATAAYGSSVSAGTVSAWVPVAVRAVVPAAAPGATLHYRVVARNGSGSSTGADATITTPTGGGLPGGGGPGGRPGGGGPGVLSDRGAIAIAHYGGAEIWLQRSGGRLQLVLRASAAARPRPVAVTVPAPAADIAADRREHLGFGLDAQRQLTAVMQSAHGLVWTHVGGRPAVHAVPGTTGRDTFPSLFRGSLVDSRLLANGGTSVRRGSLTSARARTIWRGRPHGALARDTAAGAGGAVAFVTVLRHRYTLLLVRPGHALRSLLSLRLRAGQHGAVAIDRVSPGGGSVTVTRAIAGRVRRVVFALPGGSR